MKAVTEHALYDYLAATAEQARRVVEADAGWPTYRAGIEFQSMAMAALSPTRQAGELRDLTGVLYLLWGALTDEMDAPGRGSPEQDAAAVAHMKQAATEWLEVFGTDAARDAYLDRWVFEECGYDRPPTKGGFRAAARRLGGALRAASRRP